MTDDEAAALRAAAERLVAAEAAMNPPPRLHERVMSAIGERDDARRVWWNAVHDPAAVLSLLAEREALRAALQRAAPLVRLVTVGMAVRAGDEAIEAAGLNPWAVNEGRAMGNEKVSTWWIDAALSASAAP